jgi:hypothetical protein
MLFIGDGCGLHIPNYRIKNNIKIYKKLTTLNNKFLNAPNGSVRCTDSYLVSKKCAQKLTKIFSQSNYIITMPIDHLLNYVNYYNKFNIYWAEPTIVTQGTQNGTYKSSHHLM